jgi:hypothetical protein
VIGKFLEHNQLVRDTVPSERLLEFEASQGWGPLCQFLDCPIPDEPYPKTNTTEEFQQRIAGSDAPS